MGGHGLFCRQQHSTSARYVTVVWPCLCCHSPADPRVVCDAAGQNVFWVFVRPRGDWPNHSSGAATTPISIDVSPTTVTAMPGAQLQAPITVSLRDAYVAWRFGGLHGCTLPTPGCYSAAGMARPCLKVVPRRRCQPRTPPPATLWSWSGTRRHRSWQVHRTPRWVASVYAPLAERPSVRRSA